MAESGRVDTNAYYGTGLRLDWSISSSDAQSNTIVIYWKLYSFGNSTLYFQWGGGFSATIDGTNVYSSGNRIQLYDGTFIADGWHPINNASGKTFSISISGAVNTYAFNCYGNGSFTLPTLAVSPTLPNEVTVTGGENGWLSLDNPIFDISWSGAKRGTYTIDRYSIDASKDNWTNSTNVDNLDTSNTSGSKKNVSLTKVNGLKGGDTIRIRVGMRTNNGTWWGHTYWNGSFKIYTQPTAPTTFIVPSNQEIDTSFSISWSGATAGSNGIAGYDLQIRAYDGSNWTDWQEIYSCENKTSYSSVSPKLLNVNGISFDNCGELIQFQYRIRTSDGIIATSDWIERTMGILINSPSVPRK